MDTNALISATDPVPWYQSPRIGRGIAIAQTAILAWIGGTVFEIAVAMAVKEFGLFPKGAPKTPLGMLMGGFVVLAVALGSLYVGIRLAESVPPINGIEAGVLDYETLGVAAALASQEHFNLSEFVVGFTPSAAVKGKRQLNRPRKQEGEQTASNLFAGPPAAMHPRGPPPAMQTNPSAIAAPLQAPSAPAQSPHPPPSIIADPAAGAEASSPFGVPLSAAYGF
jgi:hypothetical protein